MLVTRLGDDRRAVALGEHHQAAALRLEQIDVSVHAARGGRPERARRVALRGLRGTRVVDAVILHVLRQALAAIEPLLELGVGDVARDDQRAGQRQPRADRVAARASRADLAHRPRRDRSCTTSPRELVVRRRRAGTSPGSVSSCSRNTPSRVILPSAWRSAEQRHRDRDRAARAVARQADHAHVVAEVLAAELRADAGRCASSRTCCLPARDRGTRGRARAAWSAACRGSARDASFATLSVCSARGAADHDGEVIRRARRGAERAQLLVEERRAGSSG